MNQPRYALSKLEIDEISFVDVGANPHAKIIFSKRHEEGESMSDTFAIRNGLVSKCVQKARSRDYSGLTRQMIDDTLDAVAKSVQQAEGCDFEEAYELVVTGDDGKALYEAREACPAEGEYQPVAKFEVSKAEMLEQESQKFADSFNVPIERARELVRDYHATR